MPVYCGSDERAIALWRELARRSIWTSLVGRPAVPPGRELLRNTFAASFDEQSFDEVLDAFSDLAAQVNDIDPAALRSGEALLA